MNGTAGTNPVNPVDEQRQVDRRNDTVTVIDGTYSVQLWNGTYLTTYAHGDRLVTSVHMSENQARKLLAGLQEALA
jgi:hypothetical protein